MSTAEEQSQREYIQHFLAQYGLPEKGSIRVVRRGAEASFTTETLDDVFHPESAVLMLIPAKGGWLDGQCYDKEGYRVYAD